MGTGSPSQKALEVPETGCLTFLRTQWPLWALWAAASALFLGVGGLAGLPAEFMLYAAALTLVVLLALQGALFRSWRQRARLLRQLQPDDPGLVRAYLARYPLDPASHTLERFTARHLNSVAERQRSEREREEYFSLWLHQVKTPLSAMALLLDPAREDEVSRAELLRERQRTEHYVQLALAYLKLEQPSADLDIRPVDVDDVVRRVARRYRTLFLGSRTTLEYRPSGFRVISDAAQLELVIEQLISNSLKYASGGTIRIAAHPTEPSTLVIADDGPGIRPEDLPRLFERGYAGRAGQQRGGSSGLGLYLSRRICDRLGHGLRLESRPGEGTRAILDMGDHPAD